MIVKLLAFNCRIAHCDHRKQPLDSALAQRSRRRRVDEKRAAFSQWAEEEGVSESALLGFLLEKLRTLTQEVNMRIVKTFPWAAISPSVHRILAHSWEVIEMNGGYGLGDVSEEGLEALNKLIRQMRSHGARKDSTVHNFEVKGFFISISNHSPMEKYTPLFNYL